jgi:hypothetical protein
MPNLWPYGEIFGMEMDSPPEHERKSTGTNTQQKSRKRIAPGSRAPLRTCEQQTNQVIKKNSGEKIREKPKRDPLRTSLSTVGERRRRGKDAIKPGQIPRIRVGKSRTDLEIAARTLKNTNVLTFLHIRSPSGAHTGASIPVDPQWADGEDGDELLWW